MDTPWMYNYVRGNTMDDDDVIDDIIKSKNMSKFWTAVTYDKTTRTTNKSSKCWELDWLFRCYTQLPIQVDARLDVKMASQWDWTFWIPHGLSPSWQQLCNGHTWLKQLPMPASKQFSISKSSDLSPLFSLALIYFGNFGKYTISDCPFIAVCSSVSV